MKTLFGENLEMKFREGMEEKKNNSLNTEKEDFERRRIRRDEKLILMDTIYMEDVERDDVGNKKEYRYEQHAELWKDKVWERCMTSKEAFALIMNYLEGRYENESHLEVMNDIMSPGKEFLESGIMLLPEKVILNEGKSDFIESKVHDFNYNKIKTGISHLRDINEACPDLITEIFGRPYQHLPDYFKNKDTEPLIRMLDDSKMWRLTIEYIDPRFVIRTQEEKAALRGVLYQPEFPF